MPPCYQQVHEGGMKRQVDPSHDVKGGGEDNRHIPDPSSPDSGTRTRRQRPDDFTGCGGGRHPHTPLPPSSPSITAVRLLMAFGRQTGILIGFSLGYVRRG